MRMMIKALPLCAAIALAACGSSDDAADGAVSEDEVAARMANAVTPRAGQYQASGKLISFEMPGLPDDQLQMMRSMFESAMQQGNSYCLTEEDAEAGPRQLAQGLADSDDCSFTKFDVDGGSMDAVMKCKMEDGIEGEIKLAGTFDEEKSSMTMDIDQAIPGAPGEGRVVLKMQMDSQRTGECS